MSIFETSRKMKPNEEMCFEMGRELGKQEATPKWISVDKQLPVRGGFYITYQGKHYYNKMQILRFDSIKKEWRGTQVGAVIEGVTHWMPLPPAPEEE